MNIYYIVPAIVFCSIWMSLFWYYHVPGVELTDEAIQAVRHSTPHDVLTELQDFRLMSPDWENDSEVVRAANKMLRGDVEFPGLPPRKIRMPFDARDIVQGLPTWQLHLAALSVPDALLRAYRLTGREEFFTMAREVILGWADYDRHAWLDRGFLWNDHAVAARMLVLAEFWRLYRYHPDYDPKVARSLLQFAARGGQFLSKSGHFMFSTNHGVMQNLALWHFCVAFPGLPHQEQYKRLILARLRDQFTFYIHPEGPVLEHSAGYHAVGIEFIGRAMRYLTLLQEPIPNEWLPKYERAKQFYALLRRPDGSLPQFGNTSGTPDPNGPPITHMDEWEHALPLEYKRNWRPELSRALYLGAAYAVWWDGLASWPDAQNLSQTIVTWSYFPGHAHKLADEMSVLLWGAGKNWWTNVGYWPYGVDGRKGADSWSGSNAPHLVGESPQSTRSTQLTYYAFSDYLTALTMERQGPSNYRARRQVVRYPPCWWLVIDDTSGSPRDRTTTTWTTSPDIELNKKETAGAYRLEPAQRGPYLDVYLLGPPSMTVQEFKGSMKPFAGWVTVDHAPRPAPALVVEQSARRSWSVAAWSFESGRGVCKQTREAPPVMHWDHTNDWRIALPTPLGSAEISRRGSEIFLNAVPNGPASVQLKPYPAGQHSSEITRAFATMRQKYRVPRDFDFRYRQTYRLLLILLLQEIFFWVYHRLVGKYYRGLRLFSSIGWAVVGFWLYWNYFRSV